MPIDDKGNEVIYQSNESIRMNMNLTLPQWQVLFIAEAQLFPKLTDDDYDGSRSFLEVTIPASRVYEYFSKYGNGDRHDLYQRIKSACAQMMSLTLEEHVYPDNLGDNEKEGFIYINVFERISFSRANGLKFLFTQSMVPHLLNFWDGYTKIPVNVPFVVSSNYAVKLFMLLMTKSFHERKNHGRFWLEIGIDDLRHALSVPKGKYADRMDNFFKYVVDRPSKEIEENLYLKVGRSKLKTGRNITGVRFDVVDLTWDTIDVPTHDDEPPKTEAPQPQAAQPSSTAPAKQEPELPAMSDEETAYFHHVTVEVGVSVDAAKKYFNERGWERCKVLSDSVESAGGSAGGVVSSWKNNEPWTDNRKRGAKKTTRTKPTTKQVSTRGMFV